MPSTVIRRFAYDSENCSLDVLFVSGHAYRYTKVPAAVAQGLGEAFAKGRFFAAHIRDRYPCTRLSVREADQLSSSTSQ